MTVELHQLALYGLALLMMVASPGPLVAAMGAKAAVSGFRAAAPMALGAAMSEALYVVAAFAGLAALVAHYGWTLDVLRWVGAAWLVWMGVALWRKAGVMPEPVKADPAMVRADARRALGLGFLINLGGPQPALFYVAVFPGFFDVAALTMADMALILMLTVSVGLASDLLFASLAAKAGQRVKSHRARRNTDRATGGVMMAAGAAIAAS